MVSTFCSVARRQAAIGRLIPTVFVVAALTTACTQTPAPIPNPTPSPSPAPAPAPVTTTTAAPVTTTTTTTAPAPPPASDPEFALGVEYTQTGLGELYASTGTTWAKTRLEAFAWGTSEPAAPVAGVHDYNWSTTDAVVADYQGAGIQNVQSYLTPNSTWATESELTPMPLPENLEYYRAWVSALIERYDGDGVNDMPGLVAPIRNWVVGGEWTGFWRPANADDYLTVLGITHAAARAAYPDVQLGTIPFLLSDVFAVNPDGTAPSASQVSARLAAPSLIGRNSTSGMLAILAHPELFDYVDVHSLGDSTEIGPMLSWMRSQMSALGYSKPIWIDDAFPMGGLANYQPQPWVGWPTWYPVTDATRPQVWDLIVAAANFDPSALAWLQAQVAMGVVRKGVTAMGEGAAGINIGNTEDWSFDNFADGRVAFAQLLGAAAFMGLADVTHNHGYDVGDVRTPGAPRAGHHALSLLMDELAPLTFDSVEPVTAPGGVRGYRFQRGTNVEWVMWHERLLVLPGEPDPTVDVTLSVASSTVRVTTTPTTSSPASSSTVPASGGHVVIPVTTVPVFVAGA